MVSRIAESQNSKRISPFTLISKFARENDIPFSGKIVSPTKEPPRGSSRNDEGFIDGKALNESQRFFRVDNSVGLGDQDNQYRDSGC
jgi:hypothetical protein